MKTFAKTIIMACAITTAILAVNTAYGQKGLYFGGSIGPSYLNKSITDVDWGAIDLSGNDVSYKLYAGYKLPAFLALEGGYRSLGKIADDIAEYNSAGWDIGAKADLSLGPFQIFGKAGAFFNDVSVAFKDPLHPDINKNNTKFMFGFGAGINIQRLGIRAEWESLDMTQGSKLSMLTGGITYRLVGGN